MQADKRDSRCPSQAHYVCIDKKSANILGVGACARACVRVCVLDENLVFFPVSTKKGKLAFLNFNNSCAGKLLVCN